MLQLRGKPESPSAATRARSLGGLGVLGTLLAALTAPSPAGAALESHQAPAAALSVAQPASVPLDFETTSGNAIGLCFYNNGFVGNNFNSRSPSFEFPLGSNIDHMVRGGLWVGAKTVDNEIRVSTATVDGRVGDINITSEFLPIPGDVVQIKSTLDNKYYDPTARSEQDFLCSYADTAAEILEPGTNVRHLALNIRVDLETLLWSFPPFDDIVFANFRITNLSPTDPLYDVYAGFYAELASGYKDPANANWTSGWFKKKALIYADSLHYVGEHNYNYDGGLAPTWGGIQFLGLNPPVPADSARISFNWWNWQPDSLRSPLWRYHILSNGDRDATNGITPGTDDPVEVVSAGPESILGPGASMVISFAFLGGAADNVAHRTAEQNLAYRAGWAQNAYDLNFRIPLPPPSPALTVVPSHGRLSVRWSGAGPERFKNPRSGKRDFEGYRVYISEDRLDSDFRLILERDKVDHVFSDTGLDDIRDSLIAPEQIGWTDSTHTVRDTIPAVYHYRYDITGLRDGFRYYVAVTSFDHGDVDIGSLESGISQNRTFAIPGGAPSANDAPKVVVFPNPYRGDAVWDQSLERGRYLWFANLPSRCTIRIYTLAGDLVKTIEFDGATYTPMDIRGIYDPTDPRHPQSDLPALSGGMAAWDLVTQKDQGVASGLYLYSVEDHVTGRRQIGKFLIIK